MAERTLHTADFPGVVEAASTYLDGRTATRGVFAVATPVEGDWVKLTNSPWGFSIEETRRTLGLERLEVINDFVAQALAVPELRPDERIALGGGPPAEGRPIAVLGAGTGLGIAALLPAANGWRPVASEAGHVSFASHDEVEAAVLARLWQRFGHVSNERVLAGPGLVNLARALAEMEGERLPELEPKDVVARARARTCRFCAQAVHRYPRLLGAVAGDLALTFLARGGVFVAGGVALAMGDLFDPGRFREGFVAKGRFEDYLEPIPAWLVTRTDTGLLGAAALPLEP